MNESGLRRLLKDQRRFFASGATLSCHSRIQALITLKNTILRHKKDLAAALYADLGKSETESYMCETGLALSELDWMLRHLKKLTREKTVPTPMAQFAARSFRSPAPYGTVLIMSPWNYPVLLTLDPLIDALAAGNTAVVKPSAYAPAASLVLKQMIEEIFPPEYVAVITGGRAENQALLGQRFDKIFFTGGSAVGRQVLYSAARYLTPVTLELGGKSPCIVEKSADLALAARRIVFGKYLNCGQTCVAPDYLYCDKSIKDKLLAEIRRQIQKQFGEHPLTNPDYGKIINQKHFERILGLMNRDKIICGGNTDAERLKIEPTVMDSVDFGDAVMQEEIFGPLLPVLTYDSVDEAIRKINSMPHPLALYIFTRDRETAGKFTSRCGFGGGCINDTIIHLATSEMGFGGFGESGMGSYHGKEGFRTFSHYKSIVDKKLWLDLPMRYQPYKKINDKLIRFFLR